MKILIIDLGIYIIFIVGNSNYHKNTYIVNFFYIKTRLYNIDITLHL